MHSYPCIRFTKLNPSLAADWATLPSDKRKLKAAARKAAAARADGDGDQSADELGSEDEMDADAGGDEDGMFLRRTGDFAKHKADVFLPPK